MLRPGSPKPQIEPDRPPEALPEPIPADQTAFFRPKWRKMTRQDPALQTPGRPRPRQVAHQQSQVESAHVDQQSLAHVGVAPDEDPAQPSRGELVRERPLHQLAPLPLQPSAPPAPDPSPKSQQPQQRVFDRRRRAGARPIARRSTSSTARRIRPPSRQSATIRTASRSTGRNYVQTFIFDTVNASLGPESPTRFKPNLLLQTENSLNTDISYAASDMVNVAGGFEWRNEQYHLGEGDPASWAIGPYVAQGFSSGSNGYNGVRPENAGTWDRANYAFYGDVELHGGANDWNVGGAVRVEDFYDSFGTTINGKLSGRYGFTDIFALRAAVSSGFRAPTPGQQNVLNVTTEFDYELNDLINNATLPSTSPVAALRGGVPLQPEQSTNYSFGAVVDTGGPFTVTADYFRVDVSDRLTITRNYNLSEAEVTTLLADGITEAGNLAAFRFFVNDFSTLTQGVDVVASWTPLAIGGRTTFTGVFNFTDTEVTEFSEEHFDTDRVTSLTLGLPRIRWNFGATHTTSRWTLMARLHYYGSYWDREDARAAMGTSMSHLYPLYSGKPLVDVELGIPIKDLKLSFGAQHVFNTYPDENPGALAGVGNRYGQFGPFGFNGGYYYVRVGYSWGENF